MTVKQFQDAAEVEADSSKAQLESLGAWVRACNAVGGQTGITVINLTRFPCKICLQVAGITYRQAFLPSTRYEGVFWDSEIETENDISEVDSCLSSSLSTKLSRVSSVCSVSSQEQWLESKRYQNQYGTKCSLAFSPTGESPLFTVTTLKCGYAWYTITAQRYKISCEGYNSDWVEQEFKCKLNGVYGGSTVTLKELDDCSGKIYLSSTKRITMAGEGRNRTQKKENASSFLENHHMEFHSEPAELHQSPLAEEIAEKIFSQLNFGLSAIDES